jgi:hypothetical protein
VQPSRKKKIRTRWPMPTKRLHIIAGSDVIEPIE